LAWSKALAWVVLVCALVATLWVWRSVRDREQRAAQEDFDNHVQQTKYAIQRRMLSYEQILHGVAGFAHASSSLNRTAWREYVEALVLDRAYPGIQGVGFAARIAPEELPAHIAAVRTEGFPTYDVTPPGAREEYTAIVYLEPFTGRNLRAFGYDMFSESVRRAAMQAARDSGEARLSGKVKLVQETEQDAQAGFLMYVPVYRRGVPTATVEQRRAALAGYAYSPFRVGDLLRGIFEGKPLDLDLELYDGARVEPDALMLDSDKVLRGAGSIRPRFERAVELRVSGRDWRLYIGSLPAYESRVLGDWPWAVLAGGTALSLLLFGALRNLATGRARAEALATQMTAALRENESRFELAVQASNTGIWDWNLDTNEVYFSPIWKQQLGYSPNELQSRFEEWESRLHPDDRVGIVAAAVAYRDGKAANYDVEFRLRHRDGSYRWIATRGTIITDARGARRMIGTHRDVTEQKQTEAALRDSYLVLDHQVKERTKELAGVNEALARSQRQTALLNELAETLQACMSLAEAYRSVERFAPQLLPDSAGALYVMPSSRNYLECVASWGDVVVTEHVFEPMSCWALRRGQPYEWPGTSADLMCAHVDHGHAPGAYLCVPMSAQTETLGLLFVEQRARDAVAPALPLSATAGRSNAETVADYVALAIANIRLRETLRNQSIRDPLTKLFNRRFFEESLVRELARAQRKPTGLALLLLDVDYFKSFNDRFGHEAGDEVLQALAQVLERQTRASDVVCRLGGEEFVVLMPEAGGDAARERAEGLRRAVEQLSVRSRAEALGHISISCGVALYPEHGRDAQVLMSAADRALYRAKRSGRNRVEVYDANQPA
jgi:diguanylate cyclase (GGDEF)-like protein/PAS domain S-box-containing protein